MVNFQEVIEKTFLSIKIIEKKAWKRHKKSSITYIILTLFIYKVYLIAVFETKEPLFK